MHIAFAHHTKRSLRAIEYFRNLTIFKRLFRESCEEVNAYDR